MNRRFLILIFITSLLFNAGVTNAQELNPKKTHTKKNNIEFSPLSPLFNIWAIQYSREFTPGHEWMLGAAYANIKYDSGRSHAPGLILGYRWLFWKGAHLEYQLWPAWNDFHETSEKKFYSGLELWNEFRAGYAFEINVGKHTFTIIPQVLAGFGLIPGNKPESFMQQVEDEALFVVPVFFVGYKF